MIRSVFFTGAFLLLAIVAASAQHGSAPPGYYPMGYAGDTFTGTITAVNPDTRELTLTYSKGEKTENFVGVLKPGYRVNGPNGKPMELQMSDIPVGVKVTAYYMAKSRKVDGKKTRYYEIFHLREVRSENSEK